MACRGGSKGEEVRFAQTDSPVEGDGFEPSVPREEEPARRDGFVSPPALPLPRGTEGSNPSPSTSGCEPDFLLFMVIPPMGGAFRNCAAPKRLQELATSAITGDRGFESGSLQQ